MKAWIIYSGTLDIKKIEDLVDSFVIEGKKLDIEIEKIKNTELIPVYNNEGKPELIFLKKVNKPEFIIFWDKDIFLAKHLENMGYRLFNSSSAIDYCDDKCLMHLILSNRNISMPKTVISPMIFNSDNINEDYLIKVFNTFNNKVVIKEAKGSFGMQVYLIESKEAFVNKIKELNRRNVRFIIQEKIETSFGKDIRVNIIGNKVIGAMLRKSKGDFRANITQGGEGEIIKLTQEQEELALMAHKALGLDFSGVDLLFGEDDKPLLCEVNSNLNFLSFERLWGKSFGREILKYIIGELND